MASWFRDMPDMHTRVCVSNLEVSEAPHLCQPTWLGLKLLDASGREVAARRLQIGRNASLIVELGDLLPDRLRGRLAGGQVRLDLERLDMQSSRAYLHWYNERCLTSSHEKFGTVIPAVGGYWTVPNVQHRAGYKVHLAVVNLDDRPYLSTVTLKDADGVRRETSLDLPSLGSAFASLEDLFADPGGFLGARPGTLSFGNNMQPGMYYYFVANDLLGTWRAQHL